MERRPAVAGQFYPGTKEALEEEIRRLMPRSKNPRKVLAAIAPHAGYVYSGAVAGRVFSEAIVPRTAIVLAPNHTGLGAKAAIFSEGGFRIPTGVVPISKALSKALVANAPEIREDYTAHMAEHSLEVLLPFLLARQPKLAIVPLVLSHMGTSSCRSLGEAVSKTIRESGEDVLIVASSDMNHYEDQTTTLEKDRMAIERVLALDAAGLISTCSEHRISMCGVVPSAVAIYASSMLGAKKATLVDHATSGDVSGDFKAVVGYAGFLIE
jgi:AmmeMemoRadiSam system protein B